MLRTLHGCWTKRCETPLVEKFRQYVLDNLSYQNSSIFVFLYICVPVFCTLQILLNLITYVISIGSSLQQTALPSDGFL